MKSFTCLLIILIHVAAVSAQNNYLPGHVIINEKDTLFGLINFGLEKQNQQNCFFKENNFYAVRTYAPEDIFGSQYLQNGKYYLYKTIELNSIEKIIPGSIPDWVLNIRLTINMRFL